MAIFKFRPKEKSCHVSGVIWDGIYDSVPVLRMLYLLLMWYMYIFWVVNPVHRSLWDFMKRKTIHFFRRWTWLETDSWFSKSKAVGWLLQREGVLMDIQIGGTRSLWGWNTQSACNSRLASPHSCVLFLGGVHSQATIGRPRLPCVPYVCHHRGSSQNHA